MSTRLFTLKIIYDLAGRLPWMAGHYYCALAASRRPVNYHKLFRDASTLLHFRSRRPFPPWILPRAKTLTCPGETTLQRPGSQGSIPSRNELLPPRSRTASQPMQPWLLINHQRRMKSIQLTSMPMTACFTYLAPQW